MGMPLPKTLLNFRDLADFLAMRRPVAKNTAEFSEFDSLFVI